MFKLKILLRMSLIVFFGVGIAQAKDLPGASKTSYGVGPSGAFTFKIPIVVPSGRNNVQPNLSLSFSSSGGNGSVGVGWGVRGLGAITRCGRTIATDQVKGGVLHDKNDRFCLNGQRLIKVSSAGIYGAADSEYRTEIDRFAKIIAKESINNAVDGSAPEYWEVWHKDGMIREYGNSTSSRFTVTDGSVHSWKVSKVRDRSGNSYTVNYTEDYRLPHEISYDGGHKVTLNYLGRDDIRSGYIVGQKVTRDKRLVSIAVTKSIPSTGTTKTIRNYSLDYEYAPVTKKSRLKSVIECGLNNECMPAIAIEWKAETPGDRDNDVSDDAEKAPDDLIEYHTFTRQLGGGLTEAGSVKEIRRGTWVDIDADGRQDMVIAYTKPDGSTIKKTYINTGDGWDEDPNWALPKPLRDYSDSIVNHSKAKFLSPVINKGQLVDVNGDGLVDVVYSFKLDKNQYQTADPNDPASDIEEVKETYINTGSGWGSDPDDDWAPKDLIYDYITNKSEYGKRAETIRGRLVDLDGDGLVDWVSAYSKFVGAGVDNRIKNTWMNNGGSWDDDPNDDYKMPDVFVQFRHQWSIPHGNFVDVNGDGLQDWLQAYHPNTEIPHIATWINTGEGWQPQASNSIYNAPEIVYHNNYGWNDTAPEQTGYFIDINGDGLRDWVRSYTDVNSQTHKDVRLNTGRGWTAAQPSSGYKPKFVSENHRHSTFKAGWPKNIQGRYKDVNRDGLVDYVESYISSATNFPESRKAWLNNGTTWVEEPSNSPFTPKRLYFDYSGRDNAKPNFGEFVDLNHDGAADWIESRAGTTGVSRIANVGKNDQLEKITTTLGVEIKPTFLPLTDNTTLYKRGSEAQVPKSRLVAGPNYVTSELSVTNAIGGNNKTEYQYTGAQVHREGRGFLGFKTLTIHNLATALSQHTEYRQDYPFTGLAESSTLRESAVTDANKWLSKATNDYSVKSLHGGKTKYPYLSTRESQTRELNENGAAQFSWSLRTQTVDDYGNVLSTITDSGVNPSNILLTSSVTNTYKPAITSSWLVNRLATTSSERDEPNTTGEVKTLKTEYTYHNSQNWLVKDVIREPDSTDDRIKLTTTYQYDTYGNAVEEKSTSPDISDPNRIRTTTIGYDSDHRLPASLIDALGHESTIIFDDFCDQPKIIIDINELDANYTYDNFCRQDTVTDRIGVTVDTTYDFSPTCIGCEFSVESKRDNESPITVFYNQFSQPILTKTSGVVHTQIIEQSTKYDGLGRVIEKSQPRFSGDLVDLTKYKYDLLNRRVLTTLPYTGRGTDGFAIIEYEYAVEGGKQKRITRDTRNNPTTVFANALGQIEEIRNAMNTPLTYDYDALGNLTKTIAPIPSNLTNPSVTNTIVVGYDKLGRRTSLSDPDLGTSNYTFDAFSQLRTQTDEKGNLLSMRYDELGRLTQRDVLAAGQAVSETDTSIWTYDVDPTGDVTAKAKGKISTIKRGESDVLDKRLFTYDNLGRLSGQVTYIHGERFDEAYTYNNSGYLDSRAYPSSGFKELPPGETIPQAQNFKIAYTYENGYLTEISGVDEDGHKCITHWKANEYDALGRTKIDTLGEIVRTTRTYDPAQGVLDKIQSVLLVKDGVFSQSGDLAQNIDYEYDDNNNLTSRSDNITDVSETFIYDNLDRLEIHNRTAPATGLKTVDVTYDPLGNITKKSDVGDYKYASVRPHAVTRVNPRAYGDGEVQTSDPLDKFLVDWEWNGEIVTQAQPNIYDIDYQYDSNGNIEQQGNRAFYWTAFDKPSATLLIARDGTQRGSLIDYNADFDRNYKLKSEFTSLGIADQTQEQEETYYVGKEYVKIVGSDGIRHRYTISTGGGTIQIEREDNSDRDKPMYMLGDRLGSINVILNGLGEVEQRLEFDPWGMRMAGPQVGVVNSITNKGYTGHEMDDEVGAINMNARIYDPLLGRFLSADPVLPDPYDLQQYNRYSYVMNNPLKYTDPTGNSACGGDIYTCAAAFVYVSAARFIAGVFGGGNDRFDGFEGDIHNLGDILAFLYGDDIPEGVSVEDSDFDESIITIGIDVDNRSSGSSENSEGEEEEEDVSVSVLPGTGSSEGNTGSNSVEPDNRAAERNRRDRERGIDRRPDHPDFGPPKRTQPRPTDTKKPKGFKKPLDLICKYFGWASAGLCTAKDVANDDNVDSAVVGAVLQTAKDCNLNGYCSDDLFDEVKGLLGEDEPKVERARELIRPRVKKMTDDRKKRDMPKDVQ